MKRRRLLAGTAATVATGLAGCTGDGGGESPSDLRGELDVTLENGLDQEIEARFLIVSPDGVPRIDERPTIAGGETWQARASGLVSGRYSYTVGGPLFSTTEFWRLDGDCPRLVLDAVVADADVVTVDARCEELSS